MKKTLPTLRLSENTIGRIHRAIELHNKHNFTKLSIAEFRRLALEFFAQIILQERTDILKEIHLE